MTDAKEPRPAPRAVALRHEGLGDPRAPRVVASGGGAVAERILEVAREHGIAVREDPDLVALLAACELGDEIPLEAYAVVAELLSWLYRLDRDLAEGGCERE